MFLNPFLILLSDFIMEALNIEVNNSNLPLPKIFSVDLILVTYK